MKSHLAGATQNDALLAAFDLIRRGDIERVRSGENWTRFEATSASARARQEALLAFRTALGILCVACSSDATSVIVEGSHRT